MAFTWTAEDGVETEQTADGTDVKGSTRIARIGKAEAPGAAAWACLFFLNPTARRLFLTKLGRAGDWCVFLAARDRRSNQTRGPALLKSPEPRLR